VSFLLSNPLEDKVVALAWFDGLDQDDNGKVTVDEIEAALPYMNEELGL
jgi:hypothetical protein